MKKLGAIVVVISLSGCSSLQGSPTSVFRVHDLESTIKTSYSPSTIISTYNGYSTLAKKREYRDEVLFTYMTAINARYANWLKGLSSQNKLPNMFADTVILGLTSGAAVSGEATAQALAAGSTFLSGSQAKVNTRLYYEKTLPALVALMEAERTQVKSSIFRKLAGDKGSTSTSYGIAEVMMDIEDYERAVSIERAVARLSQQSALQLTEANQNLDQAIEDRAER